MTLERLHVCMLIDAWFPFVGGGQVHVRQLIRHLDHRKIAVSLFHSPNHQLFVRALWNLWVIPQVIMAHRRRHFNLIHAHAFSAGLSGKILSLILKIPIVYTVHGSHLIDLQQTGLKAWGERFLLTKIRYTHQISVTQSFTKIPNVNKNISIIRNGVDINEFNNISVKKHNKFTLLYVGRDHPTKGLSFLRQAFAIALSQQPNMVLRLITDGKIVGKHLIKEYKRAHAFVLPSLVEGQPIVLLEAWAAKLPVIATRTAGVEELAVSGQDAILVKPGSKQQLTQAILKLLTMSLKQRRQLGENGYRKVNRFFAWDKIASQTIQVYYQTLKQFS